ncbi:hypothetical protein [Kitasatospora albolonga]|uniref:hypothetical protein n=1 Tax=Kitasatospora albolonga TaxID=68173 RepID=UPI0031EADB35
MDSSSTGPAPAPVIYPLPALDDDFRFTFGLLSDIAAVVAGHGYPPVTSGPDLIRLQQALFSFLYSKDVP